MKFLKCASIALIMLLCGSLEVARSAAEPAKSPVHKTIFGLLLHDRGPFSDRNENGVDPNWELQFNAPTWAPWRWFASPNPMVGLTPNFNGDTSAFYAGLNYELSLSNRWTDPLTANLTKHLFIGGNLSVTLHNGPLHKNQSGCDKTVIAVSAIARCRASASKWAVISPRVKAC